MIRLFDTAPVHRRPAAQRRAPAQARPHRAAPAGAAGAPLRCACGGGCPRCSSAGQMLPAPLLATMQSRLGEPLGDVRVHTDSAAAATASRIDAKAFTIGSDIHFGAGRFRPNTTEGATRLAHELVHVVQQRGARHPDASDRAVSANARSAEREARALGAAVASGARVNVQQAVPRGLQRDGPDAQAAEAASDARLATDPELEVQLLRHTLRWWLGSTLVLGDAPTVLPPLPRVTRLPTQLPLSHSMFAPLPDDPLRVDPDVGDLFSPFGQRGATVGAGDSALVFELQRRNAAMARGLPDLRAIVPGPLRPLVPSSWRRDIADALTAAAVGNALKGDHATPIEVSDRAFEAMTGASTTVIPLPAISFDLL